MSLQNYYNQVAKHIKEHKYSVTGVIGEHPFLYTIGFHLQGKPELILLNAPMQAGHWLINQIGTKLLSGELDNIKTAEDVQVDVGGGKFPVYLHTVDDLTRVQSFWTIQAGEFLGTNEYSVLQILVPDANGVSPRADDCNPLYKVPIL